MTGGIYGGLGLAACRVALGPSTLVTTASDHVALRTPSRPDHTIGNALHLLRPPVRLGPWLDRFDRTVGVLGARERRICWEAPTGQDVGVALPAGATLHGREVVVVDRRTAAPDGALPDDTVVATDDRHFAGAKVLYLQAGWRSDEPYWRWWVDEQRALTRGGRGRVYVTYRYGIPAARVGVFHDRDGLAVVTDLVTHPLHRRHGLATALLEGVTAAHLRAHPDDRVVAVVDPPSSLWADAGFHPVSTALTVAA